MAGFAREIKNDDLFAVEELNKNPFVTESTFTPSTDLEQVKTITDAIMGKYKQYNVLVT
jgi:hypothetical protein